MARQTPFKEGLNPTTVRALGQVLRVGDPRIDLAAFCAQASKGLDTLELKDRVRHIASVVARHVDPDFPAAAQNMVAGLPQELPDDAELGLGFTLWPLCHWVQTCGLDHFEESMAAIYALTRRFTCEFAVRPFLVREPERALALLTQWTDDDNVHVRRLVSEGTRPRLPWGLRLRRFTHDPSETLVLLEKLENSPERYVQRSVANHLNDISKDHPALAVAMAESWLGDGTEDRRWMAKHALRALVKAGHPGALSALGFAPAQLELRSFKVQPNFVVGGKLALTASFESTSPDPQDLVVDVILDFVKANGSLSPKVFKWTLRTLAPFSPMTLTKGLALKPVSTRRYYPGLHRVTLQINGRALATRKFTLSLPASGAGESHN
jgi:3-methyladenine DNA glycosylase AlkC